MPPLVQLGTATGAVDSHTDLAVAKLGHDAEYQAAVSAVTLTLARKPLHGLQRVGPFRAAPFLHDGS